MLIKVTPTVSAIRPRTLFAFFADGSLKDGTPLLTASTPVSAVQPEAKARRIRNTVTSPAVSMTAVGSGGWYPNTSTRTKPVTMSARIAKMKNYVGTPNMIADSRMPLRLPHVRMQTMTQAIHGLYAASSGNADAAAAAPEQLDTATVRI